MQVEIQIDSNFIVPKAVIYTAEVNNQINEAVKKLNDEPPRIIAGYKNDTVNILEPKEIVRIYSESAKVYAVTDKGLFVIKSRLYELEERLDKNSFVRISNSEIINLKMVKGFDLSFTGTICVAMKNGDTSYVSRRYVSKIKQTLGI